MAHSYICLVLLALCSLHCLVTVTTVDGQLRPYKEPNPQPQAEPEPEVEPQPEGEPDPEDRPSDHEWHQDMEGHNADVLDDAGLHDMAGAYEGFFERDEHGQTDFNMTAVMWSAEKRRGGMDSRGRPMMRPAFVTEPVIPNSVLKRLSPDIIRNMTADDVFQLRDVTEMSYESLTHMLSNLRPAEFERLFELARNSTHDFEYSVPEPTITKAVVTSCIRQWGPVNQWTLGQAARVGPMLTGLNIEQVKRLNAECLPIVVETFARLRFHGPSARELVRQAKRIWGRISTWEDQRFIHLGPLLTYLSPRDLKQIRSDNLTSLLPVLGSVEFERGQARAVINMVSELGEWRWTEEQVGSLGKLRRFLDASELRAAPASAFSDPDMLREMLPSNGRGHRKQTKEIARVLTEEKGAIGTWVADDFRSMGPAASGMEVDDLEQLDPTVVRGAIADIADAEYSPRQRRVLVRKYRRSRASHNTSMSANEVREMKGLAVGLSTSIIADMDPVDIRQSVDVFAQNSKKMKRTQKREIIKQLKSAPGGIEDAIQDMGDMVQELPLKDLDSLCTANFTATADQNSTDVAAAGRMNWTKGQSMKLFRCFKDEVLGSGSEGESSANQLTPSTIRYMGSMAKGMTCDDIDRLSADDILPTVQAMMEQEGWSPRQLTCTHQKVRASLSHVHSDYTSDFTEIEISALSGQLLKQFSIQDLEGIPSSHCEMLYSEIGSEDVMGLKRDKRRALTSSALECRGVDGQSDPIEQGTMDVIGNLACDLDAGAMRRLTADVFTSNLYNMQKCCLDIDQLVVVGERLVQEIGSPDQWSSDTISDIGPLLVSLSPLEVESIDEDQFSLVAEDIMLRFAEYKEKWSQFCDVDLRPQDIDSRQEGFVAVAVKAKDALVASVQSEGGRRRKRQESVSPPTCEVIESLSDGNVVWTVEELEAMTSGTFDSCGYALGEVDGFSEAQMTALVAKAKEAWGQAADMTPDQVSQLGRIASGLTEAEINQLNLTETDTVYAISQHHAYTPDQLTAGVGRFLDLSGLAVASLDSLDLTALGNFLCGLTSVEMADISSVAYQEAANSIGELKSCDSSQWVVLKSKAVDEYGSIDTWMPEVFTEVGSVVAGLTAEEFGSLTNASIAGIKPHAITLIAPDTFAAGWSTTQLGHLDQFQAEAVTDDHLAALSTDQRSALLQAEYGDDVDLAPTETNQEEVTTGQTGPGDDDNAGYRLNYMVSVIVMLCSVVYAAI